MPIATKHGRVVIYLEGLQIRKPYNALITRSWKVPYKQKPLYLFYQSAYGLQSWQDGNLTWQAPTYKFTWPFDHMVLQGHETNKNHFMFTSIVPLATKLGTMITYLDRFPPLKSHDSLITWSDEITWKTKTIISPIPQCLWLQNLVRWWLNLSGSHP